VTGQELWMVMPYMEVSAKASLLGSSSTQAAAATAAAALWLQETGFLQDSRHIA
jgi:hypothetical protein